MINIAIDGPAGAGKSSIARFAAEQLGLIYVDTGALYRAIGLFALQRGGDAYNRALITGLLHSIDVELRYVDGEQRVYLCGENVTQIIRTPEVSLAASAVAEIAAVREYLFRLQIEIAEKNNVIMDGRDIGTVVLPNASLKIFLTASAEERARRRYHELLAQGRDVEFEEVLRDVNQRDHADSTRAIAPMRPAHDAVIVDTTGKNFNQAANEIISLIWQRTGLK